METVDFTQYIDLLSGAGLLCGLQKYSPQKIRQKSSSPKFSVFNTALMTAEANMSFHEARNDHVFWGRLVESAVGAYLLNAVRGTQVKLFYWREGYKEVDFVLSHKKSMTVIEVKSNSKPLHHSGIDLFVEKFKPSRILLVGEKGIPLSKFLKTPILDLV